jgi:hypothetical protein
VKCEIHSENAPVEGAIKDAHPSRRLSNPQQNMTNPKTDPKIRKPISTSHPDSHDDIAAASPEGQTTASATMIEACDRLTQKLDELTGIVREQIQERHQFREPAAIDSSERETPAYPAIDPQVMERVPLSNQAPRRPQPARSEIESGQRAGSRAQEDTGTPGPDGMAVATENARRLIDTLSRSRDGWQEQAAGLQQALEAIMDFLESQAATASPKVDVGEIMSRLRNLEMEQQTLQSQFNTNRWGPS